MTNRIALVTGASRGIGQACALTLARAGAKVALAARAMDKLEQLAAEIHYKAIEVKNHADSDNLILPAEWVLVTRNRTVLENTAIRLHSQPIAARPGLRLWTDDFNNLLQILKAPRRSE